MSVGSNSVVIINANDVMLVDSHITAAAAWVLLEELKTLTTKPVRYVVNTHFHFDHAHGNQMYGPDVEVIGHEFTREMLSNPTAIFQSRTYRGFTEGVPGQIEDLKKRVAAATDAAQRTQLQDQLAVQENYLAALGEVRPTPPNLTIRNKMTLFRITTLDELKKLDFGTVLPGHGPAFTDRQRIDFFQAYLRDFWAKAQDFKRQGVSAEDAARRLDMTNHRQNYPGIQGPGIDARAMLRAYERVDELAR
jgi:glyoxylase-like metal-dependent hydrolase (beta-lactamase superfamily II)